MDTPSPCPYDVCGCGDYRLQHTGPEHRGSCSICRNGDGYVGPKGCQRFVLFRAAEHAQSF